MLCPSNRTARRRIWPFLPRALWRSSSSSSLDRGLWLKAVNEAPLLQPGKDREGSSSFLSWPRWELFFPGTRAPLSGGLTLLVSTALTPPAPCFRSPPSLPLGCTSCSLSSSLLCFLSPFVGVLEALSPDVSRSGLRRWPGFSRNLHV